MLDVVGFRFPLPPFRGLVLVNTHWLTLYRTTAQQSRSSPWFQFHGSTSWPRHMVVPLIIHNLHRTPGIELHTQLISWSHTALRAFLADTASHSLFHSMTAPWNNSWNNSSAFQQLLSYCHGPPISWSKYTEYCIKPPCWYGKPSVIKLIVLYIYMVVYTHIYDA